MRNLKFFVMAMVLACVCAGASAQVVYFEDFESLGAGTVLHEVAGWEGWYGDSNAAASVSDAHAFSGTQSVRVDSSTDAVQVLDITEGKWVLTAMQYIPSGTSGTTRFHMQNQYRDGAIGRSVQWFFNLSEGVMGDDYDDNATATIVYDTWIELKLIIDLDNDSLEQYYNGQLISSRAWVYSGSAQIQSIDLFGNSASTVYYDDFKIQDYLSSLIEAYNPSPEDGASDVARDTVLGWTPGRLAQTHDVYFGVNFEDVNDADRSNPLDVLVGQDQAEASFDPDGLLDFGQTYYWRVDEVNGAPDYGIIRGKVWTFTAEPFAYAIEGIIATSNSDWETDQGPENTIDGSGLNSEDQHSTDTKDMWTAVPGDDPVQIQYEFDRIYKLYEMLVWNHNFGFEAFLGLGVKEATVEYSLDGVDWTVLGDVELTQAPGLSTYTFNSTVAFEGVAAKFVRLTVNSAYGSGDQVGLSEVRFMYIPGHARYPEPADGATDVAVDTALAWRSGRNAASHEIYLGTDAEDLVMIGTSATAGFAPAVLDLDTTYYWRVDEVNEADATPLWQGNLWSFTTQEYIVIDDFESYVDDESQGGQAIWSAWIDGWVEEGGDPDNGGSVVGHTASPFAEQTIVHGGSQSMPLYFTNTGASAISEADYALDPAQDWTASGIQSLQLWFYGAEGNTGQLYVKIDDHKLLYQGDGDIATAEWQPFNIDLMIMSIDLTNVTTLSIGVEGAGSGIVYIDDIRLYAELQ